MELESSWLNSQKYKTDYRELDGCHNCGNVFVLQEYDSFYEYYCHADKSERPPCGSVSMNECFEEFTEESEIGGNTWMKWARPREVKAWGKCNLFKVKKK